MEWDCLKCGNGSEGEIPMFGDDAVCEECGAIHETDWEYIDPYEGILTSWIVRLKENPND